MTAEKKTGCVGCRAGDPLPFEITMTFQPILRIQKAEASFSRAPSAPGKRRLIFCIIGDRCSAQCPPDS